MENTLKNKNYIQEQCFCIKLKYGRKNGIALKCFILSYFFAVAVKIDDLKVFRDKRLLFL